MVKRLEQLSATCLMVVMLLVGCTTAPAGGQGGALADCSSQEPPADTPVGEQLRLIVSKEVARPGEELSIRVEVDPTAKVDPTTEVMRGVDAYLECWNGQEWTTRFSFILDTDGGEKPTVHPFPPRVETIDLGLLGPGPEPIKLPSELPSGWYRIRKDISLMEGAQWDDRTLYARLQVVSGK